MTAWQSEPPITYNEWVMPRFTGLSLHTLYERLGQPSGKKTQMAHSRTHRLTFHMFWFCNGPNAQACSASAEIGERPTPPDLTPSKPEHFDHLGFPKHGWTLRSCPQHRDVFADHPEKPD